MITGWRRFSERLGGGASIFQDLDQGEALSAEAKLRPTEGGGKDPPEAKSFGKSSAEDLKRREMPPPPVTSYKKRLAPYKVPHYVEFRDMLPKSKVGKLLRREIRDEERRRLGKGNE